MNQIDYKEVFHKQHGVLQKPQFYERAGFIVRSYFNFGEYCDPRHNLPISIVYWKLPAGEQLKQNEHPNYDIVTIVLKGQFRQDNVLQENIQLKENESLLLSNDQNDCWHRDSCSDEDSAQILQIYYKNNNVDKTSMCLGNSQEICTQQYRIQIHKNKKAIQMNNNRYNIVLNLSETCIRVNTKILQKWQLFYNENKHIEIECSEVNNNNYLTIEIYK